MKILLKKCIFTLLILSILMSLAVIMPVSAATAKTVEVKGYISDGMSQDEIAKLTAQFSVSNVTGTFDAKKIDPSINAGLIAASPSKITLLEDNLALFDVYRLTKISATAYSYDDAKPLAVKGKVKIGVADESGEYVDKIIDISEMKNYQVDIPYYQKGCTVDISVPGDYIVIARREAIAGAAMAIINIPYKQVTISKKSCSYDSKTKTYFVPAKTIASLVKGSFSLSKGTAAIKTSIDTMTFKVGAKSIMINTHSQNLTIVNGKMIKNELYVPVSIIDYFGYRATVK